MPKETVEEKVAVAKGFVEETMLREEGFDPVPFRLESPPLFPTFLSRSVSKCLGVVSLKTRFESGARAKHR